MQWLGAGGAKAIGCLLAAMFAWSWVRAWLHPVFQGLLCPDDFRVATDASTGLLLKDPHPHRAGYWTKASTAASFSVRSGSETGEGTGLVPARVRQSVPWLMLHPRGFF